MADKIKENFYLILIIYTLLFSLAVKLAVVISFNFPYSYDEIIVTEVSKQPLPKLLDTVLAEPHPPGFYLFLKLFPVDNIMLTRILLIALFYAGVAAALFCGYKSKIIRRYGMEVGIILFFSTLPFFVVPSYAKQDTVSLLLLLPTLFLLLNYSESKRQKTLTLAVILIFMQFFIGYVYFVYSFVMLLITILSSDSFSKIFFKKNWYLFLFGLPSLLYLLTYFPAQLSSNLHRFRWLEDVPSGIFIWLGRNLVYAQDTYAGVVDLIVIVFLFILFKAISKRIANTPIFYRDIILMFFFVTALVSYIFGWFRIPRYSITVLFLALVIVGNYIRKFLDRRRYMYILLIVVFLQTISTAFMYSSHIQEEKKYLDITNVFREVMKDGTTKIGFLTPHPNSAFVLRKSFPKEIAIVPVSPVVNFYVDPGEINRNLLLVEGAPLDLSVEDLVELLKSKELNSYVYMFSESSHYYDPSLKLFTALSSLCDIRKVYEATGFQIIYFNNCKRV